jgi:Cysteine dioxygenase type I
VYDLLKTHKNTRYQRKINAVRNGPCRTLYQYFFNYVIFRYESKPEDWAKYAKWDKFKYTRNLIHEGRLNN